MNLDQLGSQCPSPSRHLLEAGIFLHHPRNGMALGMPRPAQAAAFPATAGHFLRIGHIVIGLPQPAIFPAEMGILLKGQDILQGIAKENPRLMGEVGAIRQTKDKFLHRRLQVRRIAPSRKVFLHSGGGQPS